MTPAMPQTNETSRVLRYPTPVVGDMMFYERVSSVLPKNRTYTLGQAHPDRIKYPNHKLCYVEPAAADNDDLQIWHYIIDRDRQDEFNWEHSTCSIGGRRFDAVVRTYITLRTAYSPTSPALGSAMPALGEIAPDDHSTSTVNALGVTVALFGSGYVLVERNESRTEAHQIDNLYVIEKRVYAKKVTISALDFDQQFGGVLPSSVTLYHRDEVVTGASTMLTLAGAPDNAYWGLQTDGVVRTWDQLSSEWYAVTTRTVIAGTFEGGIATVQSYYSNDSFSWPAVLQFIEFMDWTKREGGMDIYPLVVFKREAYNGPTKTLIQRKWSKGEHTIPVVVQMLPNSVSYSSPFFGLRVQDCLHDDIPCVCDIGNTDPEYTANYGSLRVYLATNYTDWPTEPFIAYDNQEPFRGGFLRTTRTVTPPGGTGGGAPVVTVTPPTDLAAAGFPSATSVTLEWTADAAATGHILEISTDAAFATLVVYRKPVALEIETVVGLATTTQYWARLSTLDGSFKSTPCAAITFTTTP